MEHRNTETLEYNTERGRLSMPEYGRNVLKMVEQLKSVPDKAERTRQARAVVRVMELLNPQVHGEENWEQKLWDHLHIISGYSLDVDSPYQAPVPEERLARPAVIPLKKKPVRATHYGRNIESIIDLISSEEDGPQKTAMIRSLAIYMRQQYLIWNKDSVADETIFKDIENLSEGRIKVPEGLSLTKLSSDASFSRPGLNLDLGQRKMQGRGGGRNSARRGRMKGGR